MRRLKSLRHASKRRWRQDIQPGPRPSPRFSRRRSKRFFFQNGGGKNDIKLTKSGQGEVLRPEIERSDRPEARQNSGFRWRGHKKAQQINLLLKIRNSNDGRTKHNFSKKFSAHLPRQNGDLGLYFRPVNLISSKSAQTPGKISKNVPKNPKKIF